MIKVKEPLPEEYSLFHEGLILYTYLHLAADKPQTDALLGGKVKAVSYTHLQVYEKVQQTLIDALDQGECVRILGKDGNRTDLTVQLHRLENPVKETIFENCVADVNIPVGEVFTSPVLEGTSGTLHVSKVYLNELQYRDLEIRFTDGMIAVSYTHLDVYKRQPEKYARIISF